MNGRDKCELLNQIRQKIADENNIEFTIYDCTFEGECTGTCPKCESELQYLERELEKKQNAGEKINIKNIFTLDEKDEHDDDEEMGVVIDDIPGDYQTVGDIAYPLEGDIIPPNDKND